MSAEPRDQTDRDLMISRRAYAVAQELLAGPVLRLASEAAEIGWHGTQTHPESGSVALVREDDIYRSLVGHVIRIERNLPAETRSVYAYVYATAPIADDFSLARRTFFGLGILANEVLTCQVEVLA
jgi:hypothetical protein